MTRLPWSLSLQRIRLQSRRPRFCPWVGKISWKRKWQPTPVLLPGEVHEQRSLAGYSPWGHKESDMTEQLTLTMSFPAFNTTSCRQSYNTALLPWLTSSLNPPHSQGKVGSSAGHSLHVSTIGWHFHLPGWVSNSCDSPVMYASCPIFYKIVS